MTGALLLVHHLWPALAAAGALGLLVGAASCGEHAGPLLGRAAAVLWCGLTVAALVLVLAGIVSGRWGLRTELATSLLVAYLSGCALGCGLRGLLRREKVAGTPPPSTA